MLPASLTNFAVAWSEGIQNGTQNPIEQLCYANTTSMTASSLPSFIEFANEQVRTFDMFMRCSLCAPLPDGVFGQPFFNYNTWCNSVPNNSDATAGVVGVAAIDAADPRHQRPRAVQLLRPDERRASQARTDRAGRDQCDWQRRLLFAVLRHVRRCAARRRDRGACCSIARPDSRTNSCAIDCSTTPTTWARPGDDNFFGNGRIDVAGALSKGSCLPTPTPTVTNTPTVTLTPTITPTHTPKNLAGDTDGDTVTNDIDDNDDDDGCSDAQETGLVPTAGGLRDPHNFWDFFDTPTGAGPTRDQSVSALDIFRSSDASTQSATRASIRSLSRRPLDTTRHTTEAGAADRTPGT